MVTRNSPRPAMSKIVERQVFDRDSRGCVTTLGPVNQIAIDLDRMRADYPHIERRDGFVIRWSRRTGGALGLAAVKRR